MTREGQIVLFAFPQTDQGAGSLRPALVVRSLPGSYDDWLVCMISSQLHHEIPGVDEVIRDTDSDFEESGLKTTSLVRVTRLAVVSGGILEGTIGRVPYDRLDRIRKNLANWILGDENVLEQE